MDLLRILLALLLVLIGGTAEAGSAPARATPVASYAPLPAHTTSPSRTLSRKDPGGEQGFRKVVRTFRNTTDQVVRVRIAPASEEVAAAVRKGPRGRTERSSSRSSEQGGDGDAEPPSAAAAPAEQTIYCTPGHPWWVRDRGWVYAGALRAGDQLVGDGGEALEVLEVEVQQRKAETFNFEVEGWHTYYVAGREGTAAAWVHNSSFDSPLATVDLSSPGYGDSLPSARGAIYKLKDRDTGEVLKVGETGDIPGRAERYRTAGNRTGRNLELELHDSPGSKSDRIAHEARARAEMEAAGHKMPWDNTRGRLGRPGPGVPGTRLPRRLRSTHEWQGEQLVKKKGC